MNVSRRKEHLPCIILCIVLVKTHHRSTLSTSFCRTGPLRKTKILVVFPISGGKQNSQNQAEKPFHCNVCDGTFSRYSSLWSHKRLHSGDKPFKCEVCGLAFAKGKDMCMRRLYKMFSNRYFSYKFGWTLKSVDAPFIHFNM